MPEMPKEGFHRQMSLFGDLMAEQERQKLEIEAHQRRMRMPEHYGWTGKYGLVRIDEHELLNLLGTVIGDEVAKDALRILMKRTELLDTSGDKSLASRYETASSIEKMKALIEKWMAKANDAETRVAQLVGEVSYQKNIKERTQQRLLKATELLRRIEEVIADEYEVLPLSAEDKWLQEARVFIAQADGDG